MDSALVILTTLTLCAISGWITARVAYSFGKSDGWISCFRSVKRAREIDNEFLDRWIRRMNGRVAPESFTPGVNDDEVRHVS